MFDTQSLSSSNRLLGALSHNDRDLLAPSLEIVELEIKQDIEVPKTAIENVYFPESCIVSCVNGSEEEHVEVGVIGREGMTGLAVVLGTDRWPNRSYVQVAGKALRITADNLRRAMGESDSLRSLLLRYVQTFLIQASQTALANARFKIEERLARWILMSDDRLNLPAMPLTHEFLSIMLGVRRAGVTDAIHALVGRGLIKSDRGLIQVIDRDGLIEWANGCYGVPEQEYQHLIGAGIVVQ
jgi:CRP-like cAMP-binding protein